MLQAGRSEQAADAALRVRTILLKDLPAGWHWQAASGVVPAVRDQGTELVVPQGGSSYSGVIQAAQ